MRKVTIKTIAKESGFSEATVSLVLNNDPRVAEDTKLKIIDIAKKYNFRPNYYAKKLSTRKKSFDISEIAVVATRTISVFISSIFSVVEEMVYRDNTIN
ncbi:MAG: LacI family DNA-binding transcriptional regulator [Endomicrobiia bacterium]